MRTSPAKLLILVALSVVLLVEARTLLAFFDVWVSPLQTAVAGALLAGLLVLWAVWPAREAEER